MAEQENKEVTISGVSPRGVFKYPYLVSPDYGTKEHPNPDGSYSVRLVVDEKTKDAFLKKLMDVIKYAEEQAESKFEDLKPAVRKKLGSVTWNDVATPIYDDETEEETGEYEFRFKTKASGKNAKGKEWKRKLPLFDAKGKPIKNIQAIWGGTEGKLSFIARSYFVSATGAAGVTLYLEAAQIIKLVAGAGDRDADGFGFDEEEGYEADDAPFDDSDANDDDAYQAEDDEGDEDF